MPSVPNFKMYRSKARPQRSKPFSLNKESKLANDVRPKFVFFIRQRMQKKKQSASLPPPDLGVMWQDLQLSPMYRFKKSAHILQVIFHFVLPKAIFFCIEKKA